MEEDISYLSSHCYLAYDSEANTQIVQKTVDVPLYSHGFIRVDYEEPHLHLEEERYCDHDFSVEFMQTSVYHFR